MVNFVPAFMAGYILDILIGDPQWMPHPIRWIGLAIEKGEKIARRMFSSELIGGAILSCFVVLSCFLITRFFLAALSHYSNVLSVIAEALLIYFSLSTKDLAVESSWVKKELESGNIAAAREKLSWIVGRDTMNLDEREIVRGTVETIAESTVDGIIAPMFYAILGGAPLAIAYKAVNTLDSMIGHRNERYLYFGRFAAKLDHALNWVPARLSGIFIPAAAALLGKRFISSVKTAWFNGAKMRTSNSEISEAAMAGALGVQLGGVNYYKGMPITVPLLGTVKAELCIPHIQQAIQIMLLSSVFFFMAALICKGFIA